jgi:hypothetical protein
MVSQFVPLLAETPRDPLVQWALIALATVTVFYAVIIRPAMKKKKDPLARQPAIGSLSQQRSTERQMQNLLVELSEMTRQISAQLDTRAQKLEMLIQDADERIATLKQLERPAPASQKSLHDWTEPAPAMTRNIPIPEPAEDQHHAVYALADQGRSAGEIARELDRPRGEVELILALRPAGRV